MADTFRALCAELADALAEWRLGGGPPEDTADAELVARARALLAEPEAEGPTDQELLHLYQVATPCYSVEEYKRELDFARAVLARWGPPVTAPVPESTDEALANFTAWFCRNYPGPDTLIHRPEWHAPKVFRAASDALARWGRPTPQPPADGEVAELVEWLHRRAAEVQAENCTTIYSPHLRRVADLLAQRHPAPQPVPEVEGPTDEELPEDFIGFEKGFAQEHLARLMRDAIGTETNHNAYIVAAGRILDRPEFAHVARWGRPTPQPVAVSERWPNFSDCDPQERVWAWNPVLDHWKLSRINRSVHTHWLPAHALPLPLPAPEATNE